MNLNQIKVVFNKEVDERSAENPANYILDGTALTASDEAVLQKDGKTVIITLDTPKTQYDKFIFETTKGIFTKDKLTTFPAYEKEVTFSVPIVESVEVIGNI